MPWSAGLRQAACAPSRSLRVGSCPRTTPRVNGALQFPAQHEHEDSGDGADDCERPLRVLCEPRDEQQHERSAQEQRPWTVTVHGYDDNASDGGEGNGGREPCPLSDGAIRPQEIRRGAGHDRPTPRSCECQQRLLPRHRAKVNERGSHGDRDTEGSEERERLGQVVSTGHEPDDGVCEVASAYAGDPASDVVVGKKRLAERSRPIQKIEMPAKTAVASGAARSAAATPRARNGITTTRKRGPGVQPPNGR